MEAVEATHAMDNVRGHQADNKAMEETDDGALFPLPFSFSLGYQTSFLLIRSPYFGPLDQ